MEEINHDAEYDILTVQDISTLLSETLDETIINGEESIVSSDDDFEPALETEEINILELSSDPISAALYPLRKDVKQTDQIVREIQSESTNLGHMDGGSMATTTHESRLLFDLVPLTSAPKLRVADARAHIPTHIGKMYLESTNQDRPIAVPCFYTPSLPATIISPSSITKFLSGTGYSARANLSGQNCAVTFHKQHTREDIRVPCVLNQGLLFATIICPNDAVRTSEIALDIQVSQICDDICETYIDELNSEEEDQLNSDARARL